MALRACVVLLAWPKLIVINNSATTQKHHKNSEAALQSLMWPNQHRSKPEENNDGKILWNNPAALHSHLPVLQCCFLDSSQTINTAINSSLQIWTITVHLFGSHTSIVVHSVFNNLANLLFSFLIEMMAMMSSCFPAVAFYLSLELRPLFPCLSLHTSKMIQNVFQTQTSLDMTWVPPSVWRCGDVIKISWTKKGLLYIVNSAV